MKVVLDTCVLFPTVMREVLVGVAETGAFTPVWSERILEEWARAARKIGPTGELQARSEIAALNARFPASSVTWKPSLQDRLWLPDANDVHVLAAAVASSADAIITVNAKDFPRNVLAEEGVSRADPDGFLLGFWQADPDPIEAVCRNVLDEARRLSGDPWEMRALLKKARLPRLGKALSA